MYGGGGNNQKPVVAHGIRINDLFSLRNSIVSRSRTHGGPSARAGRSENRGDTLLRICQWPPLVTWPTVNLTLLFITDLRCVWPRALKRTQLILILGEKGKGIAKTKNASPPPPPRS